MTKWFAVALLTLALPARAQPLPDQGEDELPPGHPPVGPADVIRQGQEQPQDPQAGSDDAAADPHQMGGGPEVGMARPSTDVPPGTIRVFVVEAGDRPVGGAPVIVGILGGEGREQDRRTANTDADGVAVFSDLETGFSVAYRVSTIHEGATYAATPFRMPPDMGFEVKLTRLPTTRDERTIVQLASRTFFELADDRLRVSQAAELMNMGNQTYVFPEEGTLFELPAGFTAFQSEDVMTDQRIVSAEEGFRVLGSLPPGRVRFVWGYDLPISGSRADLSMGLPYRTWSITVQAEAAPGMDIDVTGLPSAEVVEHDGHRLLVTEAQMQPGDAPMTRLRISVTGIPGPGPWRWLALGAAFILVLGGLFLSTFGTGPAAYAAQSRERRRKELLEEAAEIERLFRKDEIGPKYRAGQMEAIAVELSSLLRQEDAAKATGGQRAGSAGGKGKGAGSKAAAKAGKKSAPRGTSA